MLQLTGHGKSHIFVPQSCRLSQNNLQTIHLLVLTVSFAKIVFNAQNYDFIGLRFRVAASLSTVATPAE